MTLDGSNPEGLPWPRGDTPVVAARGSGTRFVAGQVAIETTLRAVGTTPNDVAKIGD